MIKDDEVVEERTVLFSTFTKNSTSCLRIVNEMSAESRHYLHKIQFVHLHLCTFQILDIDVNLQSSKLEQWRI